MEWADQTSPAREAWLRRGRAGGARFGMGRKRNTPRMLQGRPAHLHRSASPRTPRAAPFHSRAPTACRAPRRAPHAQEQATTQGAPSATCAERRPKRCTHKSKRRTLGPNSLATPSCAVWRHRPSRPGGPACSRANLHASDRARPLASLPGPWQALLQGASTESKLGTRKGPALPRGPREVEQSGNPDPEGRGRTSARIRPTPGLERPCPGPSMRERTPSRPWIGFTSVRERGAPGPLASEVPGQKPARDLRRGPGPRPCGDRRGPFPYTWPGSPVRPFGLVCRGTVRKRCERRS